MLSLALALAHCAALAQALAPEKQPDAAPPPLDPKRAIAASIPVLDPFPTPPPDANWDEKDVLVSTPSIRKLPLVSVVLLAVLVCVCLVYAIALLARGDDPPLLGDFL
jgi:hypothetical protein